MGEHKYPNLIKFFATLSSLHFSNAAVERVFSQLKLVKTDHRNSLKSMSFVLLLQSKLSLKNQGINSASLQPSKELLKTKELRKEFLEQI